VIIIAEHVQDMKEQTCLHGAKEVKILITSLTPTPNVSVAVWSLARICCAVVMA